MNALTAELDTRLATVAETAGIDPSNVLNVRMDVSRMLDEGLLLDVDLHNFNALRTGVTWKELGMNAGDKRRERVTKGQKVLTPLKWANRLKSLETRFRNSLVRYSYDVSIFKPWTWMPLTAFETWKTQWDDLLADLEQFKAELIAELPAITAENVTYFRAVARRAWATYQTPDDDAVVMTPDGKVLVGYDAFESDIVAGAMAKMPTVDDIKGIAAYYKTGFLFLPPEVSTLYAKASAEEAEAYAKAREARAFADMAETRANKLKWELMDAERQQAARLAAIRQAEYDRAMAELSDTMTPVRQVMLQFRDQIFQDVTDIAASLRKNGTLVGRVGNKAKGLYDLYQMMAGCTNDYELEAALKALQASLGAAAPGGKSAYNANAIEEALKTVVAVTKDAAAELRKAGVYESRMEFLEV